MNANRKPASDIPASLKPYIDALGVEKAIELSLALGGTMIYLADRPQPRSRLSQVLTADQIRALVAAIHGDRWQRVPLVKRFIAQHLRDRGMTVAEICRTLHVADATVRRWMASEKNRQASLFD